MVAVIFAVALATHGAGHVLFAANSWGYWQTAGAHSSLISGLGRTGEGIVAALWLVPLVGFLVGAWGLIGHQQSVRCDALDRAEALAPTATSAEQQRRGMTPMAAPIG